MTISLGDYKRNLKDKTTDYLNIELNFMLSAISRENNQYAIFGYQHCCDLITYELHCRVFGNAA